MLRLITHAPRRGGARAVWAQARTAYDGPRLKVEDMGIPVSAGPQPYSGVDAVLLGGGFVFVVYLTLTGGCARQESADHHNTKLKKNAQVEQTSK
jgi:hypothetical protein